jgi:microcystin-dependent protein
MANSAINPTFLIDDIESIRNTISIPGHSFAAGDVVRYDVATNSYQKALASGISSTEAATNAEAIGIVESTTTNTITLVYKGEIDISTITDVNGSLIIASTESVYYLTPDETVIGRLTSIPPSQDWHVIKPMLVRSDGNVGIVVNYIGTLIGGQSLVSLNAVQPVGTIMPYAGDTSVLPINWSLCDGSLIEVESHTDYYEAVGTRYGWQANLEITTADSATLMSAILTDPSDVFVKVDGTVVAVCAGYTSLSGVNLVIPIRDYPSLSLNRDEAAAAPPSSGQIIFVNRPGQQIGSVATIVNTRVTHVAKPDLQSRFIVGAASSSTRGFSLHDLADQGGTEVKILTTQNLPAHTHSVTHNLSVDSGGDHTHDVKTTFGDGAFKKLGIATQFNYFGSSPTPAPTPNNQNNTLYADGGAHTHTISGSITEANVGSGSPFNSLPPYMALNWIIRIKSDGAASLDLSAIEIIQDLEIQDLIDIDATSPADGQILVYDGASSKYKLANLYTGYTADSSLKIRQSNGYVGVGFTLPHAVLAAANSSNQFAIIDTDSSGTTYGGHVFVSENALLHFNNCNRPTVSGNTLTSNSLPTLTIDAQNQGVGIRTGAGNSVNGLLEIKGASNGVPLFNVSSTGIVAIGETAGTTGHTVTIKNSNGTSLLLKNGSSVSGSTIGSVVFGTETNSTTFGAGIFANYRGVSGSVSKISLALNVSDGNTLTNALYIAETKRVGVGTQSPGYQLHVSGVTGSGIAYTAGSATNFLGLDTTGGILGTTSNHPLQFITNNTKRAVIDVNGNLGINVETPNSLVHTSVSSGTNRIRMRNTSSTGYTLDIEGGANFGRIISDGGAFSIYTSGSETFRASGNRIGIDTSTLTEKLNVNGSVKANNVAKGWVDFSATGGINASVNASTVTVTNPATGTYIVNHGMNATNYAVNITVGSTGPVFANVASKSGNTFEIRAYSSSSSGLTSGLHSISAIWYSI